MALNEKQLAELEKMGPANVRMHVQSFHGTGTGAAIPFSAGDMVKADVLEWLSEKHAIEEKHQNATLRWAKIAGWAGIASVFATMIGIWLQK